MSACIIDGTRSLSEKFDVYYRWYTWHGTY